MLDQGLQHSPNDASMCSVWKAYHWADIIAAGWRSDISTEQSKLAFYGTMRGKNRLTKCFIYPRVSDALLNAWMQTGVTDNLGGNQLPLFVYARHAKYP